MEVGVREDAIEKFTTMALQAAMFVVLVEVHLVEVVELDKLLYKHIH